MIYLASPYTHALSAVQYDRFAAACVAAGHLLREGKHVFSPIAHSHPIARWAKLGTLAADWRAYNLEMLGMCNRLVVLRLPGWEESVGVRMEVAWARERGMPVEFMDPVDPPEYYTRSPVPADVRDAGE